MPTFSQGWNSWSSSCCRTSRMLRTWSGSWVGCRVRSLSCSRVWTVRRVCERLRRVWLTWCQRRWSVLRSWGWCLLLQWTCCSTVSWRRRLRSGNSSDMAIVYDSKALSVNHSINNQHALHFPHQHQEVQPLPHGGKRNLRPGLLRQLLLLRLPLQRTPQQGQRQVLPLLQKHRIRVRQQKRPPPQVQVRVHQDHAPLQYLSPHPAPEHVKFTISRITAIRVMGNSAP